MVYTSMRRWSVVPQRYLGSTKTPRMTYIVPMTPAASVAQVAMMENKNRLMSHAHEINHAVDEAHDKAENAFEMAADAQEQITASMDTVLQNQGIMFLLIACFIIMFMYIMQRQC
jgi:hypothetical protein